MKNWKDRIYFHSPVGVQNLAVSLMGHQLKKRRYGPEGQAFSDYLARTEMLDAAALGQLQEETFAELLRFALDHVPFYRDLARQDASLAADPPTLASLHRLPVVEKDMLRRDPAAFLADKDSFPGEVFTLGTSGTSGTPLKLSCDTPARQRHYAFWTRLRKRHGIAPLTRRATFFGRIIMPPDADKPPFWRFDRAQNNVLFSSYHLAEKNLPHYYRQLCDLAPAEIIGYPSSLFQVAKYIVSKNLPFPAPKVVFTTAETLLAHQRLALEKAFGAPVIDQYGCTEMVIFVAQCAHGGYHLHPEHGYLEILDEQGNPAPEGTAGSAVCTGFLNRAMPLIRYRIGDRLIASSGSCPCGSAFPMLSSIEGRMDDILLTVDGRPMTRLDPIFKTLKGIAETQIIQEEHDLLVIRLVADETFDSADEGELVHELRKRAGSAMRIRIEHLEAIPKDKNGKFRTVISRVG